MDDPKAKNMDHDYSYCWTKREHCETIHDIFVKQRRTITPCRPQSPAYCFRAHSDLFQLRRYYCAATLEHCENVRTNKQAEVKPVEEYTFSPCTEHP